MPPPAEADELHAGLQDAIAELRKLVHGVMLTEGGLYGAVQELAQHIPIPTQLDLDPLDQRLSPTAEGAGYFLASEAFTKAVKHSHAQELQVHIARDNGHLRIEIADDGIGGASHQAGTGLRRDCRPNRGARRPPADRQSGWWGHPADG